MKKLYRPLCFVAAVAAMSLTSCQKENFNPAGEGETVTITVHANVEDVANATKTHIEGTQVLWDENEEMKIIAFNNADPENTGSESNSTEFTPSADFTTATFKATVNGDMNPDRIAGVYPADAAKGLGSVSGKKVNATSYKVELNAAQSATADSYDPASYIMIARADAYALENGEWTAYYKRATALNHMILSGITDDIKSVTITFPEGQQAAGRRYFNLATGEAGEIYHEPTNVVTVNYATPLKAGNGENDVWFTSWNVNVKTGESITVKAESATKIYTKTLTATKKDVALMENYLNIFPFDMTGAEVETIETDDNIIYSNTFAIGEGDFTIDNKVINASLTYVWSHDDKYACMKASAYVNKTNYEAESWLISPVIDLSSETAAYLTFEHATNFFDPSKLEDEASVWAKVDGTDNWEKVSGITYPTSQSWTFVSAGDIDLSAYAGNKMQFAFVYKSTEAKSGTWEVKNVEVKDTAGEVVPPTPDPDPEGPIVLSFPDDNSENNHANNYTSTWTAMSGDYSFEMVSFNNFNWDGWTYVRCGHGKTPYVSTIGTMNAMPQLSSVEVAIGSRFEDDALNDLYLAVYSDAQMTQQVGANIEPSGNRTTNSVLTFVVPEDIQDANLYYKIVFDCAVGSRNGFIEVSKVTYIAAE